MNEKTPMVSIIMGSQSDYEVMQHASKTLDQLNIEHEVRVMSAHRTPDFAREYIGALKGRGVRVLIAAAGGAAHLAGVAAAHTTLPVLGVPMQSALDGLDSLLSTVQMPAGIPVATLAIGKPGAINASLFAAAIIALGNPAVEAALDKFRREQTEKVLAIGDPRTA